MLSIKSSKEIANAKNYAWEQWSEGLDLPYGRQNMFKIVKKMRKNIQDSGIKYIKDERGDILAALKTW